MLLCMAAEGYKQSNTWHRGFVESFISAVMPWVNLSQTTVYQMQAITTQTLFIFKPIFFMEEI